MTVYPYTMGGAKKGKSSEVDAYIFIKENLRKLGWVVKNPYRNPDGQVYTQNECLSHPRICEQLGKEKPENIVKLNEENFWVIEAKRNRTQIEQAIQEAEEYARKINESCVIKSPIISGVAGNDSDGYIVKSKFFENGEYKLISINEKELTGLLSPEITKALLSKNKADLPEVPIDLKFFTATAEQINKILHIGGINKNTRARVMAALLLSLIEDTQPNINAPPSVLIEDINSRAKRVLSTNRKPEFYSKIEIGLPTNPDNHSKFKTALVDTFQELNNLNIRSAMNSGTDVLGQFYEVFLKYGNGAKEIGIVLTPRHITRFAADVLDIGTHDIVYDPTCGTGGFLVAAFDHVRQHYTTKQLDVFKETGLFGIDQDGEVAALAIVNMIFRGDGKNNIKEGNCFSQYLIKDITKEGENTAKYTSTQPAPTKRPITKVLMNPPFALKIENEYKFVQAALDQMEDGGLLFSVLPVSTLFEDGEEKEWRKNRLLKENTILSVITFPPELFQPTAGTYTLGLIVKKGMPHPKTQKVLWVRVMHDGFVLKKRKRLPHNNEPNDLEKIRPIVKAFLRNTNLSVESIPEFIRACPIDFKDTLLELVPEAYLEDKIPDETEIKNNIESGIREYAAFLIRHGKVGGEP